MKPSEFFTALLHFFNDFIGMTAPGFVLLVGLRMIHSIPTPSLMMAGSWPNGSDWLIVVIVSYVCGHALLSLHQVIWGVVNYFLKKRVNSNDEPDETRSFTAFKHCVKEKMDTTGSPAADLTFNELRAVAMSKSLEAGELGRRFKFIELFCNGIGTGLLLLLLSTFASTAILLSTSWPYRVGLVFLIILLFTRGQEFAKRARDIPFSVALTDLLFPPNSEEGSGK